MTAVEVGHLRVTIYYDPECGRCGWALKDVPVAMCPYYLCLASGDKGIHDHYVAVAQRRHPNWLTDKSNTYEHLLELRKSIASDGFVAAKSAKRPMKVWKDSRLLEEGHHRAAVLLALYGPQFLVDLVEDERPAPVHEHICGLTS